MFDVKGPLYSAAPRDFTFAGLVYNQKAPAPASGQGCALQGDSQGNLLVNISSLPVPISSTPAQINAENSSTTPLGIGAAFTGAWVDITASQIASMVTFSIASQNGTLAVQWSQDASNIDHIQSTAAVANDSAIISDTPRARYFRVVYTNGSVSQVGGYFRLQTLTLGTNTSATVRDLDTLVSIDDEALVCRSVLTGRILGGSSFTDVITDVYGSLQTVIGGQAADAFGRVRSSAPASLFDAKFEYTTQPLLFTTGITGTGSVAKTANESSLTLSTGGTANNAAAINQTKQYFPYEPGKGQQIMMTGLLGVQKTNVRQEIGYFDASNGVFFRMDGWPAATTSNSVTGMCVVQRSSTSGSAVDTVIPQASWNFDPMNGTGPSGITLDFSKTQLFVIDFQWLGVGRVRFGFFVNGVLLICHQIYNANSITGPYTNTGALPCRASITNAAAGSIASTTTMKQVCMTVISEGGTDNPSAYLFSASNGNTLISGITTRQPLISIRPKATFNSIVNRAYIELQDFDVYNNSAPGGFWELVYNGTLSGGAGVWTSADANSVVEYNVDRTACANGTVVASGYVSGGGKATATINATTRLPLALDISGANPDILTLCATDIGSAIAALGALRWLEIR